MKKSIARPVFGLLLIAVMLFTAAIAASAASSYTVTVTASAGGTAVTGSSRTEQGGETVQISAGKTAVFMAAPSPYYRLKGWYENGELLSQELYFEITNVQADHNVTAEFEDVSAVGWHASHDGFTAWNDSTSLPTVAGNYYLATDVTINGGWHAPNGTVLCLNGHVINNMGEQGAVSVDSFYQVVIAECNYDVYHFFDENGIGEWVLNDDNYNAPHYVYGGVITGEHRGMYVYDQGSLHMFGGNVVGVSTDKDGAGVSVSDGGLFYMYDGTIQGNVNTYNGLDGNGVRDYDGGGGLFVDEGSQAFIGGYSMIANNTALYTDNGGGVYNYKGVVYLGDSVYIADNRGVSGGASNYQSYGTAADSILYVLTPLASDAWVGVNSTGTFSLPLSADYSANFFSDRVNYTITVGSDNSLTTTKTTTSGTIVTAGTRGAGTATVNGSDGKFGVVVSGSSATLVATPVSSDYSFIGWYDADGKLLSTNATYNYSIRTSWGSSSVNVQAYFAIKEKPISVDGAGSYFVFNSGENTARPTKRYKNPAYSTFTNDGKYLYFTQIRQETWLSGYDDEGPVGLPFVINGTVLEKSTITMNCFDIDEASGERDVIYLRDITEDTEVRLGHLTGRNQEWNTTSFTVAPELLKKDHTYQLYLKDTVSGWVTWVDTASITIGAMEEQKETVDPIIEASISATINSSRLVSPVLDFVPAENGTYNIEFKATYVDSANPDNNDQHGSLFVNGVAATTDGKTVNDTFTLESGAPEGTYRVEAYIMDLEGNVLKIVSCNAGYAKSAVTYDANGGTNNLPEDNNAYTSGDMVTVKFDYTPSFTPAPKLRTLSTLSASNGPSTFTGWATSPDATTPDYTEDGTNTFTIGDEDVTLYAVYEVHEYTVTAEVYLENGGGVTFVPNDGIVYYDGTVTITATANVGYVFDGWYEDDILVSQELVYDVEHVITDRHFVAKFVRDLSGEANFSTTFDAGYYGLTREDKEYGIIAFNMQYTGTIEFSDIQKFGLWLFKTTDKEGEIKTECVAVDALQTAGGKFFATVSGIAPEEFDTIIYVKPYCIDSNGNVHYGSAVSATVNTIGKWLGQEYRTENIGGIVGL